MKNDTYRFTQANLSEKISKEYSFYSDFDYESLNSQEDYEADSYAGALLNQELTGVLPANANSYITTNSTGHSEIQLQVDLETGYNYIVFYATQVKECENLSVYVLDKIGNSLKDYNIAF